MPPQDWRDVRFDTGAKLGDDANKTYKISQQGSMTYLPWFPAYPSIPHLPPPEANPDPGGEDGIPFIDPDTGTLVINFNGQIVNISLPPWFRLLLGDPPHVWQIDDLPTTDPGSEGVWLSPT